MTDDQMNNTPDPVAEDGTNMENSGETTNGEVETPSFGDSADAGQSAAGNDEAASA